MAYKDDDEMDATTLLDTLLVYFLSLGNTVCVQCDSKAQRGHLGGRCTGHGSDEKRTRFKNILTPRCHGKWTRMDIKDECPCKNGPDFIFV
jgi:hypothetical protein